MTLAVDFPIAFPGGNDVSFARSLGARYPDEGFARYGVELTQHASAQQAVEEIPSSATACLAASRRRVVQMPVSLTGRVASR
jgi:hypothetical protein